MGFCFFFTKWQNVCVKEDFFHIFTGWGSDCFKFHHVLAFTLSESLMGPEENGFVQQLIICSKCRTCSSLMSLFYDITFCQYVSSSAITVFFTAAVNDCNYSPLDKKMPYLSGKKKQRQEKGRRDEKHITNMREEERVRDERATWVERRWRQACLCWGFCLC